MTVPNGTKLSAIGVKPGPGLGPRPGLRLRVHGDFWGMTWTPKLSRDSIGLVHVEVQDNVQV